MVLPCLARFGVSRMEWIEELREKRENRIATDPEFRERVEREEAKRKLAIEQEEGRGRRRKRYPRWGLDSKGRWKKL